MGKAAIREYRFSRHNAFPKWERRRGGGFAAKKGSQPRLAALGSPFQGKGLAWSLPPSYGRRCPEGAEVGWGKRYEREGDCLKYAVCESTLSTATRSPFPNGEGCDTRIPLFSTQRLSRVGKAKSAAASPRIYMGRCPKVCGEQISRLRFSDIIRLTANDKDVSLRSKCRYGRV